MSIQAMNKDNVNIPTTDRSVYLRKPKTTNGILEDIGGSLISSASGTSEIGQGTYHHRSTAKGPKE